MVMNSTAVHYGVVSDGNTVAYYGFGFIESTMQYRAILDVYFIADADTVDVSADDCVEPYAAIISHDHIADDGGVGGDETVFAP